MPISHRASTFTRLSRRWQWSTVLLLLLVLSLAGAAALEAAARGAHRLGWYTPKMVREPYLQANPYLDRVLKPGTRMRVGNATIDVNSLGFRGPEFAARKPDHVFRIFVLGGSTTFGYPASIPRTEDTYPFKLQEALRQRLGTKDVEVINAGVTGYTLRTSVVNYATRLTWYEPDMIVIYHAVNDLIIARTEEDLFESVIRAAGQASIAEQIRDASYLLLELNFRFFQYFRHPAFAATGSLQPSDTPAAAALAYYERHLRQLVELARGDGVQVVIGNESTWIPEACEHARPGEQPGPEIAQACFGLRWYYPHLTTEGIRRSFDAVAAIQQNVARTHGLTWVDMNPVVPRSPDYYHDFCHTRPAGTTLIANEFARRIAEQVQRSLQSAAASARDDGPARGQL